MAGSVISTVAGIGAGLFGAHESSKAIEEAADQAAAVQWRMYEQSREDLAPWREAGAWALDELRARISAGPGEFRESPYYGFLVEEGEKGINRAAKARGLYGSGRTMKELARFNLNLASTEYNNWLNQWYQSLNPWQSMAGVGQTTAGQTATAAMETGRGLGSTYLTGGQAEAQGYMNMNDIIQGGLQNIYSIYQMNKQGLFSPVATQ